jgi:hypothetical protein
MRHRDRGLWRPNMCWISKQGHLCRSDTAALTRAELGLGPVVVEQGETWSLKDEKEERR